VRERWGITTETAIIWDAPKNRPLTVKDAEREIADLNSVQVPHKDSSIRAAMRGLKIPTVHKMEGNIAKLREWLTARGKKLVLV
jgi:hypothetical protein